MRNHLSETLMLNDIQITIDYMSRWVALKRRVGAVISQRVLKVLFYVNILPCFFVVENCMVNDDSVAIGDNGNRLIFEIWWNFCYDLFSIKNYYLPVILVLFKNAICQSHYWFSIDIIPFHLSTVMFV